MHRGQRIRMFLDHCWNHATLHQNHSKTHPPTTCSNPRANKAGVVILTQTCDIVRNCVKRPFIEAAPLVEVDEDNARQVERGYFPNYATIPALRSLRLVADLDRVLTFEKSIVANWVRTQNGAYRSNQPTPFTRSGCT